MLIESVLPAADYLGANLTDLRAEFTLPHAIQLAAVPRPLPASALHMMMCAGT